MKCDSIVFENNLIGGKFSTNREFKGRYFHKPIALNKKANLVKSNKPDFHITSRGNVDLSNIIGSRITQELDKRINVAKSANDPRIRSIL